MTDFESYEAYEWRCPCGCMDRRDPGDVCDRVIGREETMLDRDMEIDLLAIVYEWLEAS